MALASSLLGEEVLKEVLRLGGSIVAGNSFQSKDFLIILHKESISFLFFDRIDAKVEVVAELIALEINC